MTACAHEFSCKVDVFLFEDKPGNGTVEVSGRCAKCAAQLIFQGPRGVSALYPVASVGRDQLRAPVTIGAAKFEPLITVLINGPELPIVEPN